MLHLLYAAQHSVTREAMAGQFSQAEQINRERFGVINKQIEQVNKQFGHVYKEFDGIKQEIKTSAVKHDRLLWALFTGMLAIFFKDVIIKMFA